MIELFAGIGGIRLGFERAFGHSVETVFVSEIDEHARKTYAENFRDEFELAGDITKIDAADVPEFDICLAGFPCQAFSIAGRRAGFDDDYHGTCRGTLFQDVVRICERHKPKVIFCENVKGLVGHDRGRTFKIICAEFERIGYKIFAKVLNSRDFGLPQNRERIYLVCFRNDIAPESFDFPAPCDESFSIRDILDNSPVPAKYYISDVYLETLRQHRQRHEAAGHGFGYEVKDLDGVSNALVCGGMGRERNLIVDPRPHSLTPTTQIKGNVNTENIRKLTPREWARLQGFDDQFRLKLCDTQLYKQFGNAVSVNVIEAVATEIRRVLEPMAGNKGEWSELYALLKILADGGLNAQVHGETVWLSVTKVFREDVAGFKLEFQRGKNSVTFRQNGARVNDFTVDELAEMSREIWHGITVGDSAFQIESADKIMNALGLTQIKSPANRKTDIEIQIRDPLTACESVCGYSIKSYIDSPPTLLNPSKRTNFRFDVPDMDDVLAGDINAINTKAKVQDRVAKIPRLEFDKVVDETFAGNLGFIDTHFDKIVAEMLKLYYGKRIADCALLATKLEDDDPLKIGVDGSYRHKIKKFLCAVALGLKPATQWNGLYEANGGYIIVDAAGNISALSLHNINEFETYLLNNTRLDTASTRRYNFGTVHDDTGGGYFIDLNLQIRFKNNPHTA